MRNISFIIPKKKNSFWGISKCFFTVSKLFLVLPAEFPSVWSLLGPVSRLVVPPLPCSQSNWSPVWAFVQEHVLSKSQEAVEYSKHLSDI